MVAPQAKKTCVVHIVGKHTISERRACQLVGANRTGVRYNNQKPDEEVLILEIRELAMKYRRFGYRRIHMLLKRAGKKINHKRVYRLYRKMGLKVLKETPHNCIIEDFGLVFVRAKFGGRS